MEPLGNPYSGSKNHTLGTTGVEAMTVNKKGQACPPALLSLEELQRQQMEHFRLNRTV